MSDDSFVQSSFDQVTDFFKVRILPELMGTSTHVHPHNRVTETSAAKFNLSLNLVVVCVCFLTAGDTIHRKDGRRTVLILN